MKTLTLFLSLFAIITLSYNCTGTDGIDGMDGRNGTNGRDGTNGTDGKDGKDGVANVGSAIYDVEPSAWTGNIDGFVTTLIVPELTQNIHENGAVLIYILKNENTPDQSFNQLPYTWLYNSLTEYMDFDAYIGEIDITLRWVDNGINNTEAPTGNYAFKVIIIEGTPLAVLKAKTDISNPDAVMEYLSNSQVF